MTLRPYQQQLFDDIRKAFREGKRKVCAVLSCGGGKSVIAASIAKKVTDKGKRVLFIVHRRELCQQIYKTKSLTLYIQQSMRAMRYRLGKTTTIIDHVGNCFEHGLPDDDSS